jgi:hypothetical protein
MGDRPATRLVSINPCKGLEDLPEEFARDRVLSEHEIRVLWHGLDRNDLPWDRRTCLAIKFALVSMLRSFEMLGIERSSAPSTSRHAGSRKSA